MQKLSDFGINVNRNDTVFAIKKTLTKSVKQPPMKIKLLFKGQVLDDNQLISNMNHGDIFVNIISDEEALCYTTIKLISNDHNIPSYIQVRKSDTIESVETIILSFMPQSLFYLLKDDGTKLESHMTISQSELADKSRVYIVLREAIVNITNPTGEEASLNIKITNQMKGSDLKIQVASIIKKEWNNLALLITDAENSIFESIENDRLIFKCGITDKSVVKWVEVESLENIVINPERLNKAVSLVKVYKAYDERNKRHMAMKEYSVEFKITRVTESKALGNELMIFWKMQGCDGYISHMVQLYGIYVHDCNFYFGMELMKESLRDFVDERGHLNDKEVVKFTRQIIDGLMFLHGIKILHRNLKCSSVLLDKQGKIKLCSFGLSKYVIEGTHDEIFKGIKGSKVTNYYWASPETLESSIWSVYTDVWSLGATVVEMRTGKKPYHNMTQYDASYLIMENRRMEYDKLSDVNNEQRAIFDDFISCCTKGVAELRSLPEKLLEHAYLKRK